MRRRRRYRSGVRRSRICWTSAASRLAVFDRGGGGRRGRGEHAFLGGGEADRQVAAVGDAAQRSRRRGGGARPRRGRAGGSRRGTPRPSPAARAQVRRRAPQGSRAAGPPSLRSSPNAARGRGSRRRRGGRRGRRSAARAASSTGSTSASTCHASCRSAAITAPSWRNVRKIEPRCSAVSRGNCRTRSITVAAAALHVLGREVRRRVHARTRSVTARRARLARRQFPLRQADRRGAARACGRCVSSTYPGRVWTTVCVVDPSSCGGAACIRRKKIATAGTSSPREHGHRDAGRAGQIADRHGFMPPVGSSRVPTTRSFLDAELHDLLAERPGDLPISGGSTSRCARPRLSPRRRTGRPGPGDEERDASSAPILLPPPGRHPQRRRGAWPIAAAAAARVDGSRRQTRRTSFRRAPQAALIIDCCTTTRRYGGPSTVYTIRERTRRPRGPPGRFELIQIPGSERVGPAAETEASRYADTRLVAGRPRSLRPRRPAARAIGASRSSGRASRPRRPRCFAG